MRVELTEGRKTVPLDDEATRRLAEVLHSSCVVTATTDDGAEGPLLVIELHHDLKPALIDGMDLTPAEILALWSIPDLRKRLERVGRIRAKLASNEPDLEHGDTTPPVSASMFEQFAGVFHAFGSFKTRIERAVADKSIRSAARMLYGQNLDSPSTVLTLVRDQAAQDPALAYVTYRCASQLVESVDVEHPRVAAELPKTTRRARRAAQALRHAPARDSSTALSLRSVTNSIASSPGSTSSSTIWIFALALR